MAEVESVLAGSPDSIWGLLNFIRLAIAPQFQYMRGSGAGAGSGGAAAARPWGHGGAGTESARRCGTTAPPVTERRLRCPRVVRGLIRITCG